MRTVILIVALLSIGGLAVLTALDISRNGLTGISVVALGVLLLFCTGIIGSLLPPRR